MTGGEKVRSTGLRQNASKSHQSSVIAEPSLEVVKRNKLQWHGWGSCRIGAANRLILPLTLPFYSLEGCESRVFYYQKREDAFENRIETERRACSKLRQFAVTPLPVFLIPLTL